MTSKAALLAGILTSLMTAALQAQQATDSSAATAPRADESAAKAIQDVAPIGAASADADADQTKADATKLDAEALQEALLDAKAAGYKLVDRNGKEVVCKKETVTGSRIATRTVCLTLQQWADQRRAHSRAIEEIILKSLSVNPKAQ